MLPTCAAGSYCRPAPEVSTVPDCAWPAHCETATTSPGFGRAADMRSASPESRILGSRASNSNRLLKHPSCTWPPATELSPNCQHTTSLSALVGDNLETKRTLKRAVRLSQAY